MSSEPRCPGCGGPLRREYWFDEEGVDAWACDADEECGWGDIGEDPPGPDDEPFYGSLAKIRAAVAARSR